MKRWMVRDRQSAHSTLVQLLSTDSAVKESPTPKRKLAKDQATLQCGRSLEGSPVLPFAPPPGALKNKGEKSLPVQ